MPNKGRGKRNKKAPQRWSMYPELHEVVSQLLDEDDIFLDFRPTDDENNCIKEYDTNVMGKFPCRNPNCTSDGWSSKRIPITIRMYRGAQYNVRVYHQRCQKCDFLSRPVLDGSYAERTAYRLKKWFGVEMEAPCYNKRKGLPHHGDLCEGCQAGHCKLRFEEC